MFILTSSEELSPFSFLKNYQLYDNILEHFTSVLHHELSWLGYWALNSLWAGYIKANLHEFDFASLIILSDCIFFQSAQPSTHRLLFSGLEKKSTVCLIKPFTELETFRVKSPKCEEHLHFSLTRVCPAFSPTRPNHMFLQYLLMCT